MYGTQTDITVSENVPVFENDVKMYGTQTVSGGYVIIPGLRMM